MKKLILVLIFVSLAIVFSVSVMAQSDTEDIIVSDVTANEQLQNAGVAYCPFGQSGQAGCYLLGDDGLKTSNSYPIGCCQTSQLQPPPEPTPDEGNSAGTVTQVRRGCCGR
jgi:hypothetical protein